MKNICSVTTFLMLFAVSIAFGGDALETGFANPPREARLRAYWWWLNGNVTKASITRDLTEMKAKGFGGALICDADGSSQDGNERAPHGPTFFTPEWRELYKHALREADRLGLEMSLNIQSGWNLGGPMIKPEQAPKKLVWSEARVKGPGKIEKQLALPKHKPELYGDVFVLAYPVKYEPTSLAVNVSANSEQPNNLASKVLDGNESNFWVSSGTAEGQGPSRKNPIWLQFEFDQAVGLTNLTFVPRPGYGPKEGEIQVSADGKTFRTVMAYGGAEKKETTVQFPEAKGKFFRLVVFNSFDPRFPNTPRNVQIAEVKLSGSGQSWPSISKRRGLQNYEQKAMLKPLSFSAPDTTPLLVDLPAEPGEEDARVADVVDISKHMDKQGVLRWDVPTGNWEVLRLGYTLNDHCKVSTCSEGWEGYALDVSDIEAMRFYWNQVVDPLIHDAGPLAGTALKYLHTDSWEVEVLNWTGTLREEFRRRRGYDIVPYLPIIAGRILDSRPVSNRFLHDLRKTFGDLAIDNHYRLFRDEAHKHGLEIHPESGGPHAVPIDAQRCLGYNDVPMSEFWASSWRHRIGDSNRFFVKQPAMAAHVYGHKLVAAEGFTTIGPHWQETVWDNLKPAFDHAICEGLNLLVWHAFICSPAEMGVPGQEYFAGTHFNPNSTWWPKSGPFLAYINRNQFMMQRGLFVADACYYYGDHVPNFAQLKRSDPAGVLPGYDYDVVTEEAILTRMSVKDGRIVLPDGMSYRVLVLPSRPAISFPVMRKLKELVQAGATIVGGRPETASGLENYPQSDAEVVRLAEELWGKDGNGKRHANGRVIKARAARETLLADGVKPDFEFSGKDNQTALNYIHRREGEADIYFVANSSNRWESVRCTFRIQGKQPELWDAVTGEIRPAVAWNITDGRTSVPMDLPPYGSLLVVFRKPTTGVVGPAQQNFPQWAPAGELSGNWTVRFNPRWGGPETAQFPKLQNWTERPEPGIKYYSGTAVYQKTFDLPAGLNSSGKLALNLGEVHELAEVKLNGRNLGVIWSSPFQVDVSGMLKPSGNELEIEVVNFWPNRVIGDLSQPPEKRLTKTTVRKFKADSPLVPSGLMGPVRLMQGKP